METFKIFIVEDDKIFAKRLNYELSLNPDFEIEVFYDGSSLLHALDREPDFITLDYHLPDSNGDELLKKVTERLPHVPVLIVSGQQDVSTAIELLKNGAYDYLVKDNDLTKRLRKVISNIRERVLLQRKVERLEQELNDKFVFRNLIKGKSTAMIKVYQLMQKALATKISVSIMGETGTGKELVAKAIHFNSPRKKCPFVALNVSAVPAELIESEMFGFEKGAFTGAVGRRIGKFEEANGGTLFLDEIGDMDINMQTKLLRVLQEEEFTRIGSNKVIKTNCRIMVATHKNLATEVKNGNFREDLYYRLLGLPIELPPLRQREQDIIYLSKFFIKQFCKENEMPKKELTPKAIKKLNAYQFPGNVRELKAIIELALVLSTEDQITEEDISFNSSVGLDDLFNKKMTLKEYNTKIVEYYLEKNNDDIKVVAQKLDIGKSTIYRMMQNKS
ncbi:MULTISPECIES: sigma-54 dependent transcriptional regulator [unclassified Lentimicrobium]|uniref:sigma-54-dependent transcriptional regulator n=1 Tax=unclassified Lentimicrobium TaxID=2677434 RepID=UPI001557AB01|nr:MULTISPECIES: sigma-54 dependent transcriptional regulator [unclassified Lentimicrobium]NPD46965.1 sigma-54-dependent Fis family transcriptional regulator [Lentimicrobium sp. S6]NPD84731.1 sigma-54-dependent Fis family transcriptional regulator [Lentimicrobium sp. L6]